MYNMQYSLCISFMSVVQTIKFINLKLYTFSNANLQIIKVLYKNKLHLKFLIDNLCSDIHITTNNIGTLVLLIY